VAVGARPVFPSTCHVLAEDADLAEVIPAARRQQAIEDCVGAEVRVPRGPWTGWADLPQEGIGLLVLSGLLRRRVGVDRRFGAELLGECDVLRPWQGEEATTLSLRSGWSVLEPSRLALLDARFTRQLGRYPELGERLFERSVRRSRRLAVNMAIVNQARVDVRLHMLFWQLAGRWGRVRGDGVILPLRLTHSALAEHVAARRPTVTSALSQLARRGLVRVVDEGWLLAGDPPSELPSEASVLQTPAG
jgi:CRP/FNR family cyclic AMP-dependent transcriptional regulator